MCSSRGGNECACKGAIIAPHNPFLVCTPKRIRLKCHGEHADISGGLRTHIAVRRLVSRSHLLLTDSMRLKPQPIKNSVDKPYIEEDKVIIGQHIPAIDFGKSTVVVSKSRDRCSWGVISGKKTF